MSSALGVKRRIVLFCASRHREAIANTFRDESPVEHFADLDAFCATLLANSAGAALVDSGALGLIDRDLVRIITSAGSIPVVVLTPVEDRITREVAIDLGAFDFASLPVVPLELRVRMRAALRVDAQQRQLQDYARYVEEMARLRAADVEQSRVDVLLRLGKAAEYRDLQTGYHVFRVGLYARELATAMGLDHDSIRTLLLVAPLHDVGKIGIPDQILLKRGRLTSEEWRVMRRHAEIGARILREAVIDKKSALAHKRSAEVAARDDHDQVRRDEQPAGPPPAGLRSVRGVLSPTSLQEKAAQIAMTHHERWDGSGYPNRLAGEQIPIMGRIVALADVYDAVTSRRPYKRSLEHGDACSLVKLECGSHFDPAVCSAFDRVHTAFADINAMYGADALAS